jgi:hypothetical protein
MESAVPGFEAHDKREIARVAASAKFANELIAQAEAIVRSVASVPQDLFNVTQVRKARAVRDHLRPIAQPPAAFAIALNNEAWNSPSTRHSAGENAPADVPLSQHCPVAAPRPPLTPIPICRRATTRLPLTRNRPSTVP